MSARCFLGKPLSVTERHVVSALVEHDGVPLSARDLLDLVPINRDPCLRQSPLRRLYVVVARIVSKGVPIVRHAVSPGREGVCHRAVWSLTAQAFEGWEQRWFPVKPVAAPPCAKLSELPTVWRPLVSGISVVHAVAPDDIIGKCRRQAVVIARDSVWFRLNKECGRSLGEIGRRFGRQASGVGYGVRRHLSRQQGEARPC